MRPNQPVRDGLVIETTTKVRNDHTKRLSDTAGVELEGEIDLLEPRAADSQEVRALHDLLTVYGHTARNLSACKEMAE